MENQLVYPMATYVFYIGVLIIYNLIIRVRAVKSGEVDGRFFKTFQGDCPERLHKVTRHVDNQFQLPPLFMLTCIAHMVVGGVNSFAINIAWFFVASRGLHTYLHLGRNHPLQRASAYALGWTAVLLLWISIFLTVSGV